MTQDCLLCGAQGPHVRPKMVEWREPIGTKRWEVLPVCFDSRDCRLRVEQLGESWPLVETRSEREAS